MVRSRVRGIPLLLAALVAALAALALSLAAALAQGIERSRAGQPAQAPGVRFFETRVEPILKAQCFTCHGSKDNPSGGLLLSSRRGVLKGGASGPAVNLRHPQQSLLIRAINYRGPQMPPTGRLPQAQIDILTRWVAAGVAWTTAAESKAAPPPVKHGPPPVNAETMKFWSFQPVKRPRIPRVKNQAWVRNPIDAFVLAKLEAAGLSPPPRASKAVLIRRAYYDLTGLPPTPDEVRAFLADNSANAWEKVVDRLLASPGYGERWGRHWLDLVRYAETNSFERDDPKPFVWRYRDYVIKALNEDKPYDQFIREQLAGDELLELRHRGSRTASLASPRPNTQYPTPNTDPHDLIIATGYYRIGQWDDEPVDAEQARYDELDDVLATTGQAFLGLTVNCGRCHDHKIDPFPQKDYYRLLAFFNGIQRYGIRAPETVAEMSLRSIAAPEEQQRFDRENRAYQEKLSGLAAPMKEIEESVRGDFTDVEKEEFNTEGRRVEILRKRVPERLSEARFQQYAEMAREHSRLKRTPPRGLEQALCVKELILGTLDTYVLLRGNAHARGDKVEPGFPSVLAPPQPVIPALGPEARSSGRRLALADWIASPQNPLTARVMVNRMWQHHFGRGIVRSPNNFGFQGTPPTHPDLLDWLASTFTRSDGVMEKWSDVSTPSLHHSNTPSGFGWRLKPLHKLIMMSTAYQMSSQPNPKTLAKDPENDLFWRFNMRRLDAEEIRDSILAVNGSLNLKMGGPSIYPRIPDEVLAGESMPGHNWGKSPPAEESRRSVYIHIKRSLVVPIMAAFDAPDMDFTCPVRFATTQPTQALMLMNSASLNQEARLLADYARKQAGDNPANQVRFTLWRVLQREPAPKEIQRGVNLIRSIQETHKVTSEQALKSFCLIALNLNEFMYLD